MSKKYFLLNVLTVFVVLAMVGGYAQAALIELPQTGQKICYDTTGVIIPCAGTGQDGEVLAGKAIPANRFINNGDGTITDTLTGLMVMTDPICVAFFGNLTVGQDWVSILKRVADFNVNPSGYVTANNGCADYTANYSDWRLANVNEVMSLIDHGSQSPIVTLRDAGMNIRTPAAWYSTSTTYAKNVGSMIGLSMSSSYAAALATFQAETGSNKIGDSTPILVRDSGKVAIVKIAATNQTVSYAAGDDGDLKRGVAQPANRFFDNGDKTVTDQFTGTIIEIVDEGNMTYQAALDHAKSLGMIVPNRLQMLALIDYSINIGVNGAAVQQGNALASLLNVQAQRGCTYWTSTSVAADPTRAWTVKLSIPATYMATSTSKVLSACVLLMKMPTPVVVQPQPVVVEPPVVVIPPVVVVPPVEVVPPVVEDTTPTEQVPPAKVDNVGSSRNAPLNIEVNTRSGETKVGALIGKEMMSLITNVESITLRVCLKAEGYKGNMTQIFDTTMTLVGKGGGNLKGQKINVAGSGLTVVKEVHINKDGKVEMNADGAKVNTNYLKLTPKMTLLIEVQVGNTKVTSEATVIGRAKVNSLQYVVR
jgi:hypothetical protein